MKSIRVHKNIWGNYCCFVGAEKIDVTGVEWMALEWLAENLKTNRFQLSDKSYFSMIDVHRYVANNQE